MNVSDMALSYLFYFLPIISLAVTIWFAFFLVSSIRRHLALKQEHNDLLRAILMRIDK